MKGLRAVPWGDTARKLCGGGTTCTLASMAQNAQLYQGIDYGAGVDRGVCPSAALSPKPNVPMPLVPASVRHGEPRS